MSDSTVVCGRSRSPLQQQRQPQRQHHHEVLPARAAHQRPDPLQQQASVVAVDLRPQLAPIDLLGRKGAAEARSASERAVERPIPVVAITGSRIRPLSVFDPFRHASWSLFVTR